MECFVRSPNNVVYLVRNATAFVHENAGLFAPEDVVWKVRGKTRGCNATHGLSTIHTGRRMTWKGWTLVSNREGRESQDLIARPPITRAEQAEASKNA